jgi:hypothetical protein
MINNTHCNTSEIFFFQSITDTNEPLFLYHLGKNKRIGINYIVAENARVATTFPLAQADSSHFSSASKVPGEPKPESRKLTGGLLPRAAALEDVSCTS